MSMMPVVASAEELPDAIAYAQDRPSSRWYVAKRAATLGRPDLVPPEWGEAVVAATAGADLSADQLEALGKKGQALKNADGTYSYPTRNRSDLARAFKAYGRGRNKAALKRYLLRRARSLHATDLVPDSWKPLRAAASGSDEVGLWVAQVRDLITEAGFDPDEFEAGTEGFETDYLEFKDDPQGYVQELLAEEEDPESDEDDADESDGVEEVGLPETPEQAPPSPAQPSGPVSASGAQTYTTTAGSQGTTPFVNVYTSPAPQVAAEFNQDALIAALKAAVAEGFAEALAVKVEPIESHVEPDSPAAAALVEESTVESTPVDMETAKAALRDRFGQLHKSREEAPVAASVTSLEAMRERIASRSRA